MTRSERAAAATAAVAVPSGSVSSEFWTGLAGGAAQRIAKDIVLHPIDTVKTRLQRAGERRLTRRSFASPRGATSLFSKQRRVHS